MGLLNSQKQGHTEEIMAIASVLEDVLSYIQEQAVQGEFMQTASAIHAAHCQLEEERNDMLLLVSSS
jgi:hypothetical protein